MRSYRMRGRGSECSYRRRGRGSECVATGEGEVVSA